MLMLQCTDYVTPEAVLKLDQEQLRGVGLSYAKVTTVLAAQMLVTCFYALDQVPFVHCQATFSGNNLLHDVVCT